jgi:hypothetical protein
MTDFSEFVNSFLLQSVSASSVNMPSVRLLLTNTAHLAAVTNFGHCTFCLQFIRSILVSVVALRLYFAVRKIDIARVDSGVVQVLDLIRFRTNKGKD